MATENYPVPAPPVPPAQYYFGYWLSGSTKIFVFVSSSNESQVVKGSIGTVNSTLYTATGSFNVATGVVTNFHMVVNGINYDKATGVLLGQP